MRKHRINLKKFDIVEEDGVVIYDESDDYDPGENEDVEAGEFRLLTNEEIFTDEYMQEYARKMDAQIAKDKRIDLLVSVGVIVSVIGFIALVFYIGFKDLL